MEKTQESMSVDFWIDKIESKDYHYSNDIRKAMTEKSSLLESYRESGTWWKPLMRNVYENHSQAVVPKTTFGC